MASGQQCRRNNNRKKREEFRRKGLCMNSCGKKAQDGLTTCRKCRKRVKKRKLELKRARLY